MNQETQVKLLLLGIAFLIVSLGMFVAILQPKHKLENVVTPVYVPTFQRGDCFDFEGEKEAWEKSPDGIVERVGKASYLILFREAAEKRGGSKAASTVSIATFDQYHHKVECPTTWIKHTHQQEK